MEELSEQLTKMIKEVQKTEAGKKLTAAGEEALKQARVAAEHVEKIAEKVGDTEVYKQVSTVSLLNYTMFKHQNSVDEERKRRN